MKKTILALLALCSIWLLSAAAAFAQSYGGASYISNEAHSYQFSSHPAQATYTALSSGQSVVGGSSYTSAHGERPLSEFAQAEAVSLGTIARELKKQHAELKKSRTVWVN
jgi:hypothetical protein